MFDEQAPDETINDPLVDFRINTFFHAIDHILSELDRMFLGDGDENYEQIELFKEKTLLSIKRMQEIKSNPTQLPKDAFFFLSPKFIRNI